MDKKYDIPIQTDNQDKNTKNNEKEYKELSNLLNFNGDYLKATQAKIAEISNYLKKFKILEDPQYYNSSKEYANLLKKSKLRLEKIIFQTLLYTNKNTFRSEDFDIRE